MDNVIKKTNLGIAVQEAISQLKLDREKNKIMGCLQRCFQDKYKEFQQGINCQSVNFKGEYICDNEFPIGEGDKQQHFRSIVFNSRLNNSDLLINTSTDRRPFTLIESFSKNEESKKRLHSKSAAKPSAKKQKRGN